MCEIVRGPILFLSLNQTSRRRKDDTDRLCIYHEAQLWRHRYKYRIVSTYPPECSVGGTMHLSPYSVIGFARGSSRVGIERILVPSVSADQAANHDRGLIPHFDSNSGPLFDSDCVHNIHNIKKTVVTQDSNYPTCYSARFLHLFSLFLAVRYSGVLRLFHSSAWLPSTELSHAYVSFCKSSAGHVRTFYIHHDINRRREDRAPAAAQV
ncbi:hypothetical protein EVAR_50868_1 [Eumeta japonica]|uniref:Uncharacterized protein n=1 Tax=Eumeta variegata TaxID=151549 RepID=A0A4C1Y7H1_EUMVA|nr:hypothetical protein EVAR_50868_1 [Eumeta japonica]